MDRNDYPIEFVDQIKKLLPDAYKEFFAALARKPSVSIQLNGNKSFKAWENEEGILWYEGGRFMQERPIFTLDPGLHGGGYYVQEASSMLLAAAIRQYVRGNQVIRALDLCAAPGGKSWILGSILAQKSIVLSNEIIHNRLTVLRENITKKGNVNYALGNFDANLIANRLPAYFDLIVVDAPCSGEGLFRKNPKAIQEWSPEHVHHCSLRQRRILADIVEALAPGGLLIYSTCTFNDKEDRFNADWLAKEFDLTPLPFRPPESWGILEISFDHSFGTYCFPHKVKGEGFFMSLFQKKGQPPAWPTPGKKQRRFRKLTAFAKDKIPELNKWVKSPESFLWYQTPTGQIIGIQKDQFEQYLILDHALPGIQFGLVAGEFKGKSFIPSPELALSVALSSEVASVELTKEQALTYLRKAPLVLPDAPKGWVLARYQGLGLGWMKVLSNRINNYWPTNWRVRM